MLNKMKEIFKIDQSVEEASGHLAHLPPNDVSLSLIWVVEAKRRLACVWYMMSNGTFSLN